MKPFICQRKPIPLKGTFLSLWLVQSWNNETWDRELTAYKEVGMEYVIFSPAVLINAQGEMVTYFPSKQAQFQKGYVGVDVYENVLRNCARHGMKCFLGTLQDDKWWELWWDTDKTLSAYDWFMDYNRHCNEVAEELWHTYQPKYPKTFKGWYLIPEFWNFNVLKPDAKGRNTVIRMIADGLGRHLDFLSELSPGIPVLTSPFANMALGSMADLEEQWRDIIRNVPFRPGDIICPQDSIGAGGTKLYQLDDVMQAYVKAVSGREGLVLWANNEDFDQTCWSSAMLDRFIRQMEITARYASTNITFAYNNYQSPLNVKPCFHRAMVEYETTGTLRSCVPTSPSRFAAEKREGALWFSWQQQEDEDIVRYEIFATVADAEGNFPEQGRKLVGVTHCGCKNFAPEIPALPTGYRYDIPEDILGKCVEFSLTAYDVYGNPALPAKLRMDL